MTPEEQNKILESEAYKIARETQRTQLAETTNLFFIFSGATLGLSISSLLSDKLKFSKIDLFLLSLSCLAILISILFFTLFASNRLEDYRETSRLLRKGKTRLEVEIATYEKGQLTWKYYEFQKWFFGIGFVIFLFGIGTLIIENIKLRNTLLDFKQGISVLQIVEEGMDFGALALQVLGTVLLFLNGARNKGDGTSIFYSGDIGIAIKREAKVKIGFLLLLVGFAVQIISLAFKIWY